MQAGSKAPANVGFEESICYRFPVVGEDWELFVDDAPLERYSDSQGQYWQWTPGFHAGTVRAELMRKGMRSGIPYRLDVSPDPAKVGQEEFRVMVDSVWDFDASLVLGEEAATTSIGSDSGNDDPSVRYMRIARFGNPLVTALSALSRQPHRRLRAARMQVPLHRVRFADVQTAISAMGGGGAVFFADESDPLGEGTEGGLPPLFDVPVSDETLDTAANRTLLALVDQLRMSIDDLRTSLIARADDSSSSDRQQELKKRLPRRLAMLGELRISLDRLRHKAPLRSVTRAEISSAGLTAIAAHPLYARAQQLLWRTTRRGFAGNRKDEMSAMSPTWGIYESWCYVSLAAQLESEFGDWRWTRARPGDGRHVVRGKNGSQVLTLYLQKTFSYYDPPPQSGLWSISAQLIPDIVLTMEDGDRHDWLVLDAKYRKGRQNVLEGMKSAHIYRDALRFRKRPPALSLLLAPAKVKDAPWTMAPEYRSAHRVGVLSFSPDMPDAEVVMTNVTSFFAGAGKVGST